MPCPLIQRTSSTLLNRSATHLQARATPAYWETTGLTIRVMTRMATAWAMPATALSMMARMTIH